MTQRLNDLSPRDRRRAIGRSGAIIGAAWAITLTAYGLSPTNVAGHFATLRDLIFGGLIVAVVLGWQLRRIGASDLPELRAAEAFGVVFIVFLVLFSTIYLSMSHGYPGSFDRPLDHIKAFYFTVTTFATVGFGDITAKTDTARLVVTGQMLFDLAFIGVLAKALFGKAHAVLGSEER